MFSIMESLENSFIAVLLRNSVFLYPVVNTGHILGVSLLVGASLPRNILTAITGVRSPSGPLNRVLRYSESSGLVLALLCGIMLFSTRPTAYLLSTVFLIKMALLLLALTTSHISSRLDTRRGAAIRVFSSATAFLWLAVLIAGRFIGYF